AQTIRSPRCTRPYNRSKTAIFTLVYFLIDSLQVSVTVEPSSRWEPLSSYFAGPSRLAVDRGHCNPHQLPDAACRMRRSSFRSRPREGWVAEISQGVRA